MLSRICFTALLLTGCRNDCQQVCQNMADVAQSDCNLEFSQDEINQCMDNYRKKNLSAEQLDTCKEHGDNIAKEWDCEDIEVYMK